MNGPAAHVFIHVSLMTTFKKTFRAVFPLGSLLVLFIVFMSCGKLTVEVYVTVL